MFSRCYFFFSNVFSSFKTTFFSTISLSFGYNRSLSNASKTFEKMVSSGLTNNGTSVTGDKILMENWENILNYFQWKEEPPSDFFKQNTWILYGYFGICIHGFVMNAFLVILLFRLWLTIKRMIFYRRLPDFK